jgi:hypothetical protein
VAEVLSHLVDWCQKFNAIHSEITGAHTHNGQFRCDTLFTKFSLKQTTQLQGQHFDSKMAHFDRL